jgi:metallo-beta-lactamase family protein
MRWLGTATRPPRHVFVVHGDLKPSQSLAARIELELGWPVTVPAHGDSIPLDRSA